MDKEIQDMLNDLPNKKFSKLPDTKLQQYEDFKNLIRDEKWKNKISNSLKNRKLSDEHIEKIIIRNKKRIVSDETKYKLSKSLKGKTKGYKRSDETKKKISESRKNIIYSEDAKKRMSIAQKKRKNHFNDEAIKKRIEKTKRPILYYSYPEMKLIKEFESIKQASIELNLDRSGILKHLNGTIKNIRKYTFKYKDTI